MKRQPTLQRFLTPQNLAWAVIAALVLGVIYYFAMPSESLRPHVRYTMGGKEYAWNGPAQPNFQDCYELAYQKRREILTGTGTNVVYHGCATFNGSELQSLKPPR